jgi:hypothetical protein
MEYPDRCIRGILNSACLLEGAPVAYLTLFEFHGHSSKEGGWKEESINWMDDEGAIDFTLKQTNEDGDLQFKIGVAILPHVELNRLKKRHIGFFDYERRSIEGNRYHGNLLLRDSIKRQRKTLIRAALAHMSEVILREDNQAEK